MNRTSLNAEHQPRTLRNKGLGIAIGEPQRVSRADEAVIPVRYALPKTKT